VYTSLEIGVTAFALRAHINAIGARLFAEGFTELHLLDSNDRETTIVASLNCARPVPSREEGPPKEPPAAVSRWKVSLGEQGVC
jgi:hypothetical protein